MKNIGILLTTIFLASIVLVGCERKAHREPRETSDEPASNLVLTEDVDVAEDQKILSSEAKRKQGEFSEPVESPAEPDAEVPAEKPAEKPVEKPVEKEK